MNTDVLPGLVAVILVSIATLAIGTWGLRISRTTSDFFVASRTVRPRLNASAIGGEYLSAASFLGVAGLLLTFGAEMLWYPVGWTAGYLVLLVLVAAPLRRSGAYTLPDFAEARLGSRGVRKLCSVLVVGIGWLYLLPQFQGAGVTLRATIDAPAWAGSLVVALVVLVLELPHLMVPGLAGSVLTGLVTAGAFAAFLSTSSGLTIAVAGVLSQDVTGRRWGRYRLGGVAAFRVAAAIAVVVPLLMSLPAQDVAVARTVGLAFAVTASTFAPLLMLGIWWRGLTPHGAVAGLLVGGLGSGIAVTWTLAASHSPGWTTALLGQPAAWSVPASFVTMVVVSRLTAASVPAHAGRFMVRLHTPEAVELQR